MKDLFIKNISDKKIWEKDWFIKIFLEGLSNDGLQKDLCREISDFINETNPKSFNEFLRIFEDRFKDSLSKKKISEFLDKLKLKVNDNEKCYLRDSPSKTRVIQWPNNQNAKIKNPEHYFDIYEDNFFRESFPIIDKSTPIGSAGSCFAQRIAHQLQISGFNYIIEEDDLPQDYPIEKLTSSNYRLAPARIGTLFNTPSLRQMIERGFEDWEPEYLLADDNGKLIDPFRTTKSLYNNFQDFKKDYQNHTSCLKKALLKCDVFIFTLGLTEAWYFAHSGKYTSVSPHKVNPVLLRQKNLSVEDNLVELEKIYKIYKKNKPNIKFIISVSPIPLNKTFSKTNHVVSATGLSKAILRVAANQFSLNHPEDVFYFPSFETVMYGCEDPWEEDKRHVNSKAVERVMKLFSNMFLVNKDDFKFKDFDPQDKIKSTPIIKVKNFLRPIKRRLFKLNINSKIFDNMNYKKNFFKKSI